MNSTELMTIGVLFSLMRGFSKSIQARGHNTARFQQNTFESAGKPEASFEDSEGSAAARPRGDKHWRKKRKRSEEPDSRGPDSRARPGSRRDSDETDSSGVEPEPHTQEEIQILKAEISVLRAQVESLEASRPRHLELEREEADIHVLVHCGPKKRSIPFRQSQGWASLRKRMIRIFGLKRALGDARQEDRYNRRRRLDSCGPAAKTTR
jgi:hypothetical protein